MVHTCPDTCESPGSSGKRNKGENGHARRLPPAQAGRPLKLVTHASWSPTQRRPLAQRWSFTKKRHLDRSRAVSSRGAVERPMYWPLSLSLPLLLLLLVLCPLSPVVAYSSFFRRSSHTRYQSTARLIASSPTRNQSGPAPTESLLKRQSPGH